MENIIRILPISMREVIREIISKNISMIIEEINLRVNKPVILRGSKDGQSHEIVTDFVPDYNGIKETLGYISNFSIYAYEEEIKKGFITIKGGHRVGITGKVIIAENENGDEYIKNIRNINSLNIRIAREIKGCSEKLAKTLYHKEFNNTLIVSPPCMGKTTVLRDLIRILSDKYIYKIGVVDERGELAASYMGAPQNNIGIRTDVLDGCPKSKGIIMLVRSMSPQIIAVDEIGGCDDINAIKMAKSSGCRVLATCHGAGMEDISENIFDNYVLLNRRRAYIYDKNFKYVSEVGL